MQSLSVFAEPNDASAEAYRLLFANLLRAGSQERSQVFLFCTPTIEEGGTAPTVANLGAVSALAGMRTIVIDADLRRPNLHKLIGVIGAPGLADVLAGEAEFVQVTCKTEVEGLECLAAGRAAVNAGQLLSGARMREVLEGLRGSYDLALITAPPVLAVADASALAPQVDGVVLVVDADKTRRPKAQQAKEQLDRVQARMLGIVVYNAKNERMTYQY